MRSSAARAFIYALILVFFAACISDGGSCRFAARTGDAARERAAFDGNGTDAAEAGLPFFNPFKKKESSKKEKRAAEEEVYIGGVPLGLTLHMKGVIVLGQGVVKTADGPIKPFAGKGIKEGDIITRIDGDEIIGAEDVAAALNKDGAAGNPVTVRYTRKGKAASETVTPALDSATGAYKLGLWIRDSTAGVGTLTFVKGNMRFGALGHPICDADAGGVIPVSGGNVYKCDIVGVIKGRKGSAGELRGIFLKNRNRIGTLDKNGRFGVFGVLERFASNPLYPKPVPCGGKAAARPGAAKLVASPDGVPAEYDIEIIKTNYQSAEKEKSMVIKITDENLIKKTGGIVQGMSGSPILQDGKLIGAVTHVFVNDPTKGFGIYIDWMLTQ